MDNFSTHVVAMLDQLNERQREAVCAPDGPLLIIAGAGSGKTKTLTTRLAFLIAHRGIAPSAILAVTFTNKAADEMQRRVSAMLPQDYSDKNPTISTLHSFGARVLFAEGAFFGRTSSYTIFDRDDSSRVIKKLIQSDDSSKKISLSTCLWAFAKIKNELLAQGDALGTSDDERLWSLFYGYERALQDHNAFDFDDLIYKVVLLWKSQTDVLASWQKKFSHILIDEYQDVNTAQHEMMSLLAHAHRNITVVGDDAQAIYGFRSCDFRNFLQFEKTWPQTRTIILEQNYRSSGHIIDASSRLIAHNVFQKPKTLWTKNISGQAVLIMEHHNEFDQADYVVDAALRSAQAGLSVGILFRTNAQSRALEQMLLEKGIPYALFGAVTFYERKEIRDIIAALRVAANAADAISLSRLEKNFPKKVTRPLLEAFFTLAPSASPLSYINMFLEITSYRDRIKHEYSNYIERYENIAELVYFSEQFSSLPDFLRAVTLASPLDSFSRKEKKYTPINLMTIHLAKGLEFDAVHVVGVNEGILPHQRSLASSDECEEERRLLYVAMTRAKKELALHFYQLPSRFLQELPLDHVIFSSDTTLDDEERYIEYD